jgi:putative ABC transport system permease protein
MMSSLLQELRVALRVLAKERAFTAVTVLTLAVAIGANTAIFSVVNGVLIRPLPYPHADRLVSVEAGLRPGPGRPPWIPFSDRGYWHFFNNNRAFQEFGGYEGGNIQWPLTGDGPPVQVNVAAMTRSAFELLGTQPLIGRLPAAEEDVPNGPRVALLSQGLWKDRYGSDPKVVGQNIELNGVKFEVIGVMPQGYDFPTPETDVWFARQLDPASENFGGHHLEGIARLKPGVTIAQAVSDAESLIARFPEAGYGPVWMTGVFSGKARVRTLRDGLVGDARTPLLILLGTVAFVLLIACGNVTNLLLVRAESRTRENAVRLALGSGRGRLMRYVLVESGALALAGGVIGVGLAYAGTRALVAAAPASVPRLDAIRIDRTVLLYTLGISVVAALLLAILPAVRVSANKVLLTLNDAGRGSTVGKQRLHVRSVLVVLQVALALVLLVGSGLMVRSYAALRSVDPGFNPKGVMTFRLSPTPAKYAPGEPIAQFYTQLQEKLEAIPGVTSASGIDALPLTGGGAYITAAIDEFPTAQGEFPHAFHFRRVLPGYFKTMGIPIVEGRGFTDDDNNARTGTLVISESFKKEFWPNASALNKRITIGGAPAHTVGVVGNVHDGGLQMPVEQIAYKPMLDSVGGSVRAIMMAVRTGGDPTALVPAIRKAVESMDPDIPITNVRTLQNIVDDSISRTTFTMSLLLLAALVALFLGSVGIYGVLSYVAMQRTAEMGVRFALGADAGVVRKIFLSHGMMLAATGVAVGLAAAVALSGLLRSLLFGVKPLDPLTLVGVSAVFLAVAGLASIIPAERAARTPPAVALRAE